ncbi:MAG: YgiT-type zinc finger protein [Rubrobacteraceae bacterium]
MSSMKCNIKGCPGSYEQKLVTLTVRHQDELVVIDHVPAEVCNVCGDQLFAPETNRKIDQLLEHRTETEPRQTVPLYDYAL